MNTLSNTLCYTSSMPPASSSLLCRLSSEPGATPLK